MTSCSFDDVVGDRATFFRDHFGRAPMLRRGALAGRLNGFPSPADLDDILALQSVTPSHLRVSKAGVGVPANAYTRTVAGGAGLAVAVDPAKVYELFRAGGTVTWNAMQLFLPAARRVVAEFAEALAAPTEVVLFATPAGNDGFAPHHDSVDVFVMQTHGTKTWRVWTTPVDRPGGEASYTADELGDPALEVTLHPGDVLYVPHGTPHMARARATMSVHLSVGVEPRRWRDLVRETVELLVGDPQFHDIPALTAGAPSDLAGALNAQLARLAERLAGVDATTEVARLVRTGQERFGARSAREFARFAAADRLTAESPVRRSRLAIDVGDSASGRTQLTVNNHRLAMPDALAAAVLSLEADAIVAAAEIYPGASPTRSVGAARSLARLGVLEVAEETREKAG
jgi:ribosomal protein L16 Arg81 hydroxylase